ncbi:MAG: hypothetical protein CVU87_13055, partial [Firmicutes bacterium HGW-Firmicutes-12]
MSKFPDLRYCVGSGNSIDEAIEDAMIAKEEWIKAACEHNVTIPEPASNDDYNGRVTLRIPKSLHRRVVETARNEGISQFPACGTTAPGSSEILPSVIYHELKF